MNAGFGFADCRGCGHACRGSCAFLPTAIEPQVNSRMLEDAYMAPKVLV